MSPTSSPAFSLELSEARLSFGGTPLFDGLELSLPAGRWSCLLGPSGVGKTSLLRLIAGLAPPGANARVICSDGGTPAGRLAYMAQQDLLLPWLSVVQNVVLGAALRGEPDRQERGCELLARVGLDGWAEALPEALSGGMRQRAALARTLMEDRPLVLMDEPFSALDVITRHEIQALAAESLAEHTVLLVTHDPLEALRLGHHIHIMAGQPATLTGVPVPDGAPPRRPADATLIARQAELLGRLAVAGATT